VPILAPNGYAAVRGMQRAAEGIHQGAQEVVDTTMQSVNQSGAVVNEVRSLEEIARSTEARDLEDSYLDIKRHHYGYGANVQSAQVDDARFEEMLDLIVPRGPREQPDRSPDDR